MGQKLFKNFLVKKIVMPLQCFVKKLSVMIRSIVVSINCRSINCWAYKVYRHGYTPLIRIRVKRNCKPETETSKKCKVFENYKEKINITNEIKNVLLIKFF